MYGSIAFEKKYISRSYTIALDFKKSRSPREKSQGKVPVKVPVKVPG